MKGSSYDATIVLSKIRCIKDKYHMKSKYVTWYGHHHLVPLISISKAPSWAPTSLAWHLDLHCSIIVVSPILCFHDYHYRLVIDTWVIQYLKTTLRLLPVVVLIDMQVVNLLQNMIISYINIYHIYLDHITSQHTLQKQVRRPLLCCCKFYMAATGF